MTEMAILKDAKTLEEKLAERYVNEVYRIVIKRNPGEKEFHQATREIFDSLIPLFAKYPRYMEQGILERIVEPERTIMFRVPWVDDKGKIRVNRGYRVQYNSAIGPYKGGIRFHPSVNSSIMKFLGFEQIFKNALTGLPIGGGKGGADFDPKGKSEGEIMRFTQSFMTELYRHIGPDIDVPAGDIGVGQREIGYMFGHYKRIKGAFEAGVFTGKNPTFWGSLGRKEATGYGAVYFTREMLRSKGLDLKGMTVIVSGSGNVSIYAIEKAQALGAKVVACSDSNGYIYDEKGLDLATIKQIKEVERKRIREYVNYHPRAKYREGCSGIWAVPCDIAMPCATQNEIDEQSARMLVKNGVKAVVEGANMPCTLEAIDVFINNGVLFGPGKAANAGGVAVSALEMAQNSMRLPWSFEEVDRKLQEIMKRIYRQCINASEEFGYPGNLMIGANISGFRKVADAMIIQGVV